jgi:hypothetical protein
LAAATISSDGESDRTNPEALREHKRSYRIATTLKRGLPYIEPAPPTGDADDPHRESGGDFAPLAIAIWLLVAIVIAIKHILGLRAW